MPDDIVVLNSKLIAPQVGDAIERDRLLRLTELSVKSKLTTIVAGAGYGKTTLGAQAKSRWKVKSLWYRLDEYDRDLPLFISYLVAGMREHYPGFGTSTLQYLRQAHSPNSSVRPLIHKFLSEIESTVHEDFIIVLDDYHSIKDSLEIEEAMEILLRDLSPLMHLVLISRAEPSLPLSRMRSMRQVTDIREEHLAFTVEEIERLYSEVFNMALGSVSIEAVFKKVGGWVSGLILLCHSLKGKNQYEVQRKIHDMEGPDRALFGYLEENVYCMLSPLKRDFLIRTAILPRINPKLCDLFLGMDNSAEILKYLEENHLFTSSASGEGHWYFYHQLFRGFLLSKLAGELTQESIVELYRRAAQTLLQSGEEDEALEYLLLAENFEQACCLLERVGKRLFAQRRFQVLDSHLDRIPDSFLDGHPGILFIKAQMAGLRGRREDAERLYGRALGLFVNRKDNAGIQGCLVESGLIYFQTGDLDRAESKFNELLDRKEVPPTVRIEVLGYLSYISAYLEDYDLADRCFDESLAALGKVAETDLRHKCLGWIYYYRGFRYVFSGEYENVLEIAEYTKSASPDSEGDRYPLGSYLLLALAYGGLRLYSRGYEAAIEGLRILREGRDAPTPSDWHTPRTSPSVERAFPETFTPWLLASAASTAAGSGKLPEAIEHAEEGLKLFRKAGFRHGEAKIHSILHGIYSISGNTDASELSARLGLDALRGLKWPRVERQLKQDLAGSLVAKGQCEQAIRLLDEIEGFVGDSAFKVRNHLLHARILWSQNSHEAGLRRLAAALEICEERGFDTLVISERGWIIPLLIRTFAMGLMRGYIQKIMDNIGVNAIPELVSFQRSSEPALRKTAGAILKIIGKQPASDLRVHLLGRFMVIRDGLEIPAGAWRSSKAKMLFQFLVHSRQRGYLNREVLMELLWPEEDPALTAKRFHVALTSLRKTLEPDLVKGVPSSFISRVGDSYRAGSDAHWWVDVEQFASEMRNADNAGPEASIGHLLKAESLYAGDFLVEYPYSEWSFQAREGYRNEYLRLLRKVLAWHERRRDHVKCMEYAEKLIAADSCAEDAYRFLMTGCWSTGDRSGIIRAYQRCGDNIATGLGCALSEETDRLYRELISTRPSRGA